nr:uncharacterized protein LOC111759160 [Dasypus novemcinctus]
MNDTGKDRNLEKDQEEEELFEVRDTNPFLTKSMSELNISKVNIYPNLTHEVPSAPPEPGKVSSGLFSTDMPYVRSSFKPNPVPVTPLMRCLLLGSSQVLKDIKQACTQYGTQSHYTIGLVEGLANTYRLIPWDWDMLTKTVLTAAEFLQFKTWWTDEAAMRERRNRAQDPPVNITTEQLLGSGAWTGIERQLHYNDQAVTQVRQSCLAAWRRITAPGKPTQSFAKVIQGVNEPYVEFIARLTDMLTKTIEIPEARELILLTLAFDQANNECKKAIRPIKAAASRRNLYITNPQWQVAISDFQGVIDNHFPTSKFLTFLRKTTWILPKIIKSLPLENACTVFTDGSSNGKAAFVTKGKEQAWQTPFTSAQRTELAAIIKVLIIFKEPLNIVSDSEYVCLTVKHIETAHIFITDELSQLFADLQHLIRLRQHPIYITHIRSHTSLPGPMTASNARADLLVGCLQSARDYHALTHINAKGLRNKYQKLTKLQAQEIIRTCPTCGPLTAVPFQAGTNPRGLTPNQLWQMDVTHIPSFENGEEIWLPAKRIKPRTEEVESSTHVDPTDSE